MKPNSGGEARTTKAAQTGKTRSRPVGTLRSRPRRGRGPRGDRSTLSSATVMLSIPPSWFRRLDQCPGATETWSRHAVLRHNRHVNESCDTTFLDEMEGLISEAERGLPDPRGAARPSTRSRVGIPGPGAPILSTKREMSVKVLRKDPGVLYLEFMSQWPQLAPLRKPGGAIEIDVSDLRSLDPSHSTSEKAMGILRRPLAVIQSSTAYRAALGSKGATVMTTSNNYFLGG